MSQQNWEKEKESLLKEIDSIPIYTYVTSPSWIQQYPDRIEYLCQSRSFASCVIASLLHDLQKGNNNADIRTHDESFWYQFNKEAYTQYYEENNKLNAIALLANTWQIRITKEDLEKLKNKHQLLNDISKISIAKVFFLEYSNIDMSKTEYAN